MAADLKQTSEPQLLPRAIVPPYVVLHDFLEQDTVATLCDFVIANEATFRPTRIGTHAGRSFDPEIRRSVGTRDLGPFRPFLNDKVLALVPDLVARLRTAPVDAVELELQLVAHNDGAFYKPHIDTQTASDRHTIRILSAVYYFHAAPKGFTGGALRLHAIGDDSGATFADIEPVQNSLLVFPSWAPHEVLPVVCPSGRFADSRFAINCWVYRKRQERS